MNKKEIKKYVNERISNKLYSKIHHGEYEVQYYFKNRHEGLAGIAQWASSLKGLKGFQGFGTGALYKNNTTPLTEVRKGEIWML